MRRSAVHRKNWSRVKVTAPRLAGSIEARFRLAASQFLPPDAAMNAAVSGQQAPASATRRPPPEAFDCSITTVRKAQCRWGPPRTCQDAVAAMQKALQIANGSAPD